MYIVPAARILVDSLRVKQTGDADCGVDDGALFSLC